VPNDNSPCLSGGNVYKRGGQEKSSCMTDCHISFDVAAGFNC